MLLPRNLSLVNAPAAASSFDAQKRSVSGKRPTHFEHAFIFTAEVARVPAKMSLRR